jgi:hypothetical protein
MLVNLLCNSPAGFVTSAALMIALVMFPHLWHAQCTFWTIFALFWDVKMASGAGWSLNFSLFCYLLAIFALNS